MQTIAEFGKIEYVKNDRCNRISVRILVDSLRVTIPKHTTQQQVLKFIQAHHEKILSKQEKIRKRERENPTILNDNTHLHTLTFDVVFSKTNRNDIFFSMKNGLLTIEFPESMDFTTEISQKYCWNGINYFMRKEARRLFPDRTSQLAAKYGFAYSTVKIQSSKSRWGSCSREKSINLSFYLMLLPAHLIDYVILHELCHTKEMNHGDKFWSLMDKVTDRKSNVLRKELKKYHMPQ
ncbi:MAG: SprT family zinc-dependent metalloprotease [Paludibacter sp.]|nr:SprT family zinc-dependent metalloprotease [Paludibacter sp.]